MKMTANDNRKPERCRRDARRLGRRGQRVRQLRRVAPVKRLIVEYDVEGLTAQEIDALAGEALAWLKADRTDATRFATLIVSLAIGL